MNQMSLTLKKLLIKSAILDLPRLPYPLKEVKHDPKPENLSPNELVLYNYLVSKITK